MNVRQNFTAHQYKELILTVLSVYEQDLNAKTPELIRSNLHACKQWAKEMLWCFMTVAQKSKSLSLHECDHQLKTLSGELGFGGDSIRETRKAIDDFVNFDEEEKTNLLVRYWTNNGKTEISFLTEIIKSRHAKFRSLSQETLLILQLASAEIKSHDSCDSIERAIFELSDWLSSDIEFDVHASRGFLGDFKALGKDLTSSFNIDDLSLCGRVYVVIGNGQLKSGYWSQDMLNTTGLEEKLSIPLIETVDDLPVGGVSLANGSIYRAIVRIR